MYIGIDFDGTIVDHRYPEIGAPVPVALEAIREFIAAGAKIILWTMRSDSETSGPTLTQAVEFLKKNGVDLFGVNINPTQSAWTNSPKAYCHLYIDDAAFGCPLRENPRCDGRPFVDWEVVKPRVLAQIASHAARPSW